MTRHATVLARSIEHLDWFRIPHTVDQVIGVLGEATREQAGTTARSRTNAEMLDSLVRSASGPQGRGGHSDPTPAAALSGEPGAVEGDETVGMIDASLSDLADSALVLDHLVSDVLGVARWHPPAAMPTRQSRAAGAVSRLHHLAPGLGAALAAMDSGQQHDADGLLLTSIADQSEWLHVKCEGIWLAAKGDRRTTASQQPGERPKECQVCSGWRKGTIGSRGGKCDQCANFASNHGCDPTEAIVRRWEYGKGATPAQIIEAQAEPKRKRSAS